MRNTEKALTPEDKKESCRVETIGRFYTNVALLLQLLAMKAYALCRHRGQVRASSGEYPPWRVQGRVFAGPAEHGATVVGRHEASPFVEHRRGFVRVKRSQAGSWWSRHVCSLSARGG